MSLVVQESSLRVIEAALVVGGRITREARQVRAPTVQELGILGPDPSSHRATEPLWAAPPDHRSIEATVADEITIQDGEDAHLTLLLEPARLPVSTEWVAEVDISMLLSGQPPQRYTVCVSGSSESASGCDGASPASLDIRVPYRDASRRDPHIPPAEFSIECVPVSVGIRFSATQEWHEVGESLMNGRLYLRLAAEPSR